MGHMMRRSFIWLGTFLFILVLSLPVASQQDPHKGPAFSDPSAVQKMPQEWKERSITYPESAGKADLVINLNQQLYPLLVPMVEDYAQEHELKIAYSEGTCGKSAGMLERKEVDMGGLCCPPGELDRLPGLKYHTIGIMPLGILVHPDNPVEDLTLQQVRSIFAGDIKRWSEVGGRDELIQVIASLHCKKRPGHWRLLLPNEDAFSTSMVVEGDMTDVIAIIGANPSSIGYESLLTAERFVHRGKVKELKINGTDPRNLNDLATLRYPLYRVFSITTWEDEHTRTPHAQSLAQYLIKRTEELEGIPSNFIPASRLREAGWKFQGTELIGEPKK
ncbi:MAG: hypothetical protein GWN86_07880 [Desulfobacterales bacterium]|nr:hypothetical protein [Desulfobacterales bacterium]